MVSLTIIEEEEQRVAELREQVIEVHRQLHASEERYLQTYAAFRKYGHHGPVCDGRRCSCGFAWQVKALDP